MASRNSMPEASQLVAGGWAQRHHRSRGPDAPHPGRDASPHQDVDRPPLRLLDRGVSTGL